MVCPKCGAQLSDEMIFCNQCGEQIRPGGKRAWGKFILLEDAVEHMVQTGGVFEPRREYAEYYAGKYAAFERALKALDVFHTAQPEEDQTCSQ